MMRNDETILLMRITIMMRVRMMRIMLGRNNKNNNEDDEEWHRDKTTMCQAPSLIMSVHICILRQSQKSVYAINAITE